jgi:two-component system, sensor histidine kinase YesM
MRTFSLQKKLIVFYTSTLLIPVIIISIFMPAFYQHLLEKETQSLTENTLTALSNNINLYLNDLEEITILPYFNTDLMKALQLKTMPKSTLDLSTNIWVEQTLVNSMPTNFQNLRQDIVGTIILPLDNQAYINTYSGSREVPDYPYQKQSWYKKAISEDGKATFISAHSENYMINPPTNRVFSVARLIKDPNTLRPLAVIMADADTSILQDQMDSLNFDVDSISVILNDQNEVFYSSSPLPAEMLKQVLANKSTIKGNHDHFVTVSKKIKPANWRIVVLLSKSQLNKKIQWTYIIGGLFAVGGLISTVLLFFILSRWIVNPFKKIISVMRKIQQGNLEVRLSTAGNDEIAELGSTFNGMIEKINDLIDREYKAVLNQRNAEYKALQSQIQPHFLFNTLNGFVALNRVGDSKTLEKAILALSSMLRYILKEDDWTTIEEECEFLKKYCELQQLRFQDRMAIEIHYDEEVRHNKIPKLLLQPLVENAIIHGIEPSDHLCYLTILANINTSQYTRFITISIIDNGAGFDASSKGKGNNIGISNVQERLKMSYQDSTFSIVSKKDIGTEVTITIPQKDVS